MNISTLIQTQFYQNRLFIQHTQIDDKNAQKKSIAKVLKPEDTVLTNHSDDEIADDEQDARKVAASEALDNMDTVNYFA